MNIQPNSVNIPNNNIDRIPSKLPEYKADNTQNSTYLPMTFAAGQSQINSSMPVSYSKLFDIEIPGLKDKASVFKLANGQKIVLCPKKGPTVVKTTYNVGSMNEPENLRGISHYIEHNLFNGSKDLAPREYDSRVADLGGGTNASTGYSKTDYYLFLQLLEDNSLEEAVRLNALQTQFPTFPIEQLEKEKEPVKSEIDMYKDNADDAARNIVLKNLYNIPTNIPDLIAGNKENINSLTREKVLDYYNTWYTPDNAVTVITGDIDVNETMQLVSKYYNKKPDTSKINQRYTVPLTPINNPVRKDIIMPNTTTPSICMGFAIPQGTSNEEMEKLEILFDILGSSDSRLSKALDKYGISPIFGSEKMQNTPDGAKAVLASFYPTEEQIEDVLKIVYEELTYIANNPPTLSELNNVKQKQMVGMNCIAESSSDLNAQLTYMATENDYNYFSTKTAVLNSCTPQDISAIAKKMLDLNKVSVCVSHSKDSNVQSINNNYINSSQNIVPRTISFGASGKPKESLEEESKKIKQYRLANNIETMAITGNATPVTSFFMSFQTDEINSTSSPAFLVLNEILDRGSQFRSNEEYNSILNSKNTSISISAGVDGLAGAAVFSQENLNDAISLFIEKINSPDFSIQEFERAKRLIKDAIMSEPVSADFELYHELLPSLGKYKTKEERLKELDALTLNDVQSLYYKIISTAQVNATITAPFDNNSEIMDTFNYRLSTEFPAFKPCSIKRGASFNIYTPNTTAKTIAVADEKSQAEISQVYKYKISDDRNVKDVAQIELLNLILGGGGMTSRLFKDLREDQKLAYRVGSNNSSEKDTGIIELSIGTTTDSPDPKEGSPENAKKAIDGFNKNVNLLKTQNVSEKELQNAKTLYKSDLLNMLETNASKTAAYTVSQVSSYNIEYYSKLLEAIDSITPDDIRAAANYVFQNPPITTIVASQKTLDSLKFQ